MKRHLVAVGSGLVALGGTSLCGYLIGVLTSGVSRPAKWPYLLFAALVILGVLIYWIGHKVDEADRTFPKYTRPEESEQPLRKAGGLNSIPNPSVYRLGAAGTGKPLRIAPRLAFLVGREELLSGLEAELGAAYGVGVRVATLCGLGGVGKTSVAVEFAHRHLDGYGVVWQFAAQEATTLKAQFGDLAALLGAGEWADAGDPVAQVHSVLAVIPSRWLLIFDNVPDEVSVQSVLPPAGNGRVLITSQNPYWTFGRVIEVPALRDDIAAAFLQKRTGMTDQSATSQLAIDLGGLPLALEQACAFMTATGRDMAEYQSMFHERRPMCCDAEMPQVTTARCPLPGHWLLASWSRTRPGRSGFCGYWPAVHRTTSRSVFSCTTVPV